MCTSYASCFGGLTLLGKYRKTYAYSLRVLNRAQSHIYTHTFWEDTEEITKNG
jgi:hypothetical protein